MTTELEKLINGLAEHPADCFEKRLANICRVLVRALEWYQNTEFPAEGVKTLNVGYTAYKALAEAEKLAGGKP